MRLRTTGNPTGRMGVDSPSDFSLSTQRKILGTRLPTVTTATVDRQSVRISPEKSPIFLHHAKIPSRGFFCGWGEIRTHGPVTQTTVFKTVALDHSATHPYYLHFTLTTNIFTAGRTQPPIRVEVYYQKYEIMQRLYF